MQNQLTYHEAQWNRKVSADYTLELVLHLSPKALSPEIHQKYQTQINHYLHKRQYIGLKDLKQFAASDETIQGFSDYLKQHQIKVSDISAERRTVTLSGKTKDLEKVLGVEFHIYEHTASGIEYIEAIGAWKKLPKKLQGVISNVSLPMGRDRLLTRVRYQHLQNAYKIQDFEGYTPDKIAEVYDFPEGDGAGECIGIIELGGTFKKSDIDGFFKHVGIDTPEIVTVGKPEALSEINDLEVTLDLQLAGALAPKAKLVVYYGHDIISAVKAALYDQKNKPSVLSISWAGAESNYSQAQVNEMNQLFYQAALLGITIVAASGDQGAYNKKNYPNVNLPASSPWVLACGGSTLFIEQNKEIIWNELAIQQGATGGGFSNLYPLSPYQRIAVECYLKQYPALGYYYHRQGVPDVAANADSKTGYLVRFNGKLFPVGGTSASTPVWAALIARLNQALGHRLGFIHTHLYQLMGSKAFKQIPLGNNGYYGGGYGWNPATGLGAPQGKQLLEALQLTQEPPPASPKQTKKK